VVPRLQLKVQPVYMKARTFIPVLLLLGSVFGCAKSDSPGSGGAPKDKPGVSGSELKDLKIETMVEGVGEGAKEGDMLTMLYRGTLADGTVFDGNMDDKQVAIPGKDPFSVVLGKTAVIQGWHKGLAGMKKNEVRKLSIPPSLGYGDKGQGEIPPNADLFFTVKCLDIVKAGEEMVIDIQNVKPGSGPEVKKGDKVTIHYVGTLLNGKQFDSSREKEEPLVFTAGMGEVVPGFDKAVLGMKKGGLRKVRIPPAAAYGADPTGGIPANSVLLFEIELLKINGK